MRALTKDSIPPDLWYRAALALIEREPCHNRRAELRGVFEERAAIAEYDGGLSRVEAERLAFRELRYTVGYYAPGELESRRVKKG